MRLIIAEKKELGQNIAHAMCGAPNGCRLPFSGNGFTVVNCVGHMLTLMEPGEIDPERWSDRRDLSALPILAEPWPLKVAAGKEAALATIGRELKRCDSVIHAGDPDDEGQLLVDEVLEHFGYTGRVERVYINDNLDKNIVKAFSRLRDNKECKRDGSAARARSVADFCFGVNESRLIDIKAGAGVSLSVGRVQTPTLGLVVRRDEEILNHKERLYHVGSATVDVDGKEMEFVFKPSDSLLDPDLKKVVDKDALERAGSSFDGKRGIANTVVKHEEYKAPLPYNLVDLIADMARRHKLGAAKVQDATQSI